MKMDLFGTIRNSHGVCNIVGEVGTHIYHTRCTNIHTIQYNVCRNLIICK